MTTTEALDEPLTVREFLALCVAVRETGARDGLRAVEDCLLDLVGRA